MYQIVTDLQKEKNRKQKLNYVSPVHFTEFPLIKENGQEKDNKEENEDEISKYLDANENNSILITTTFQRKTYKNLVKNKKDKKILKFLF